MSCDCSLGPWTSPLVDALVDTVRLNHGQHEPARRGASKAVRSHGDRGNEVAVGGQGPPGRVASQRAKEALLSPLWRPARSPSTPICLSRSGHSIA